ncbi:hypothetical protein OAN22_01265 [Alphaproteobacteria bacterium]|nr:hypothetical protein [Alphaproteobacteria bacterium]
MRHFGPFDPSYQKDGSRKYDSDRPQDAMMSLTLMLFPSSAGPLASISQAVSNYGRKATVDDVAQLLKFSKEIRFAVAEGPKSNHLKTHPESDDGIAHIIRKYQKLGKIRDHIAQAIRLEYNHDKITMPRRENLLKEKKHQKMDKAERNKETEAKQDEFKESLLKNQLYPFYTTEKIILAFFVHRFNEKKNIFELLSLLGSDFVKDYKNIGFIKDKNITELSDYEAFSLSSGLPQGISTTFFDHFFGEPFWSKESLKDRFDPQDLDFIFINTYHDLSAPIPYTNGSNPINNGNCPMVRVDQEGHKKLDEVKKSETFPDCQETALRHFFNMVLYDPETLLFKIPNFIQNENLKAFYSLQGPRKSNDGSAFFRGKWNLVIAGLKGVLYAKKDNELYGEYANLITALREILGIDGDEMPQNQEGFEAELKSIIKKMNPTFKDVKVKIKDFRKVTREDSKKNYYGDAEINIKNHQNIDFSFTLRQQGHGDIQNPHWQTNNITLPKTTFEDSALALVDRRNEKSGLYKLMAQKAHYDDDSKFDAVADFIPFTSQYQPIIKRLMLIFVEDDNMRRQQYFLYSEMASHNSFSPGLIEKLEHDLNKGMSEPLGVLKILAEKKAFLNEVSLVAKRTLHNTNVKGSFSGLFISLVNAQRNFLSAAAAAKKYLEKRPREALEIYLALIQQGKSFTEAKAAAKTQMDSDDYFVKIRAMSIIKHLLNQDEKVYEEEDIKWIFEKVSKVILSKGEVLEKSAFKIFDSLFKHKKAIHEARDLGKRILNTKELSAKINVSLKLYKMLIESDLIKDESFYDEAVEAASQYIVGKSGYNAEALDLFSILLDSKRGEGAVLNLIKSHPTPQEGYKVAIALLEFMLAKKKENQESFKLNSQKIDTILNDLKRYPGNL